MASCIHVRSTECWSVATTLISVCECVCASASMHTCVSACVHECLHAWVRAAFPCFWARPDLLPFHAVDREQRVVTNGGRAACHPWGGTRALSGKCPTVSAKCPNIEGVVSLSVLPYRLACQRALFLIMPLHASFQSGSGRYAVVTRCGVASCM